MQILALIFDLGYLYGALISKWSTEEEGDNYDYYCIHVGDADTMLLPTLKFVITSSVWKQVKLNSVQNGLISSVVSSEISVGKFPEIYSNLSGNLLNNCFHFTILLL